MCNKLPDYKEFFHPIVDSPNWGTDQLNEEVCLAEAQNLENYVTNDPGCARRAVRWHARPAGAATPALVNRCGPAGSQGPSGKAGSSRKDARGSDPRSHLA